MRCWADYVPESHTFAVSAQKGDKTLTESFTASHEPRWGIDVEDMDQIYEVAGRLSDQL